MPNPTAPNLEKMITWALAQQGKSSYTVNGVTYSSAKKCQAFVANCYWAGGQTPRSSMNTARQAMNAWKIKGTESDLKPPIGAAVYMQGSGAAGHVGLSLGEGKFIDAGASTIKIRDVSTGPGTYHYLGWGWNGGTQPSGSTVNMDAILASGGTSDIDSTYASTTSLYTTKNTRIDATVREVCYIDTDGNRTLDSKTKSIQNLNLSVINYTSFLGSLLGGSSTYGGASGNGDVDTSGITNSNCRAIFDAMLAKGLTAAQCVGILVNIKRESAFNPAAGSKDGYGSIGLCQWTFGRKTAFLNWVGSDWRNNISGQVDFLLHELETSHKSVGDKIRAVTEVSESAAIEVGRLFLWEFEIPAMKYRVQRTNDLPKDVHEIWSQIIIQPTSSSSIAKTGKGKMCTHSGKVVTSGTQIDIPNTVSQTRVNSGIWEYWDRAGMGYSNWSKTSVQRKLYDIWVQQGKKSSNLVATLDGYYLVAVTTKFGNTGDMISIVLNDGTYINAIMADGKSYYDRNSTPYGHKSGSFINVVEWCVYDPSGKFQKSRDKNNQLKAALKTSGLNPDPKTGQIITSIINYGSWL